MRLTKHHGLGNDFLVLFDDQTLPTHDYAALAVALCDRRRGVGADGLLVGVTAAPAGAHLGMVLHNADGSRAEISGNGIRCLAQAWARRERVERGTVRIATDAGLREIAFEPGDGLDRIVASVPMGLVTPLDPPPGWDALGAHPDRPALHVSVGNPHSVVACDDVRAVDLAALGATVPSVNLEIVEPGPEPAAVTMRVHERGAGITEACGSGACAVAHAAARWGFVAAGTVEITVHMDGGSAKVRLGDDGSATLIGPSTYVADIDVAPRGSTART
jgi:diaminopimelate epimerase